MLSVHPSLWLKVTHVPISRKKCTWLRPDEQLVSREKFSSFSLTSFITLLMLLAKLLGTTLKIHFNLVYQPHAHYWAGLEACPGRCSVNRTQEARVAITPSLPWPRRRHPPALQAWGSYRQEGSCGRALGMPHRAKARGALWCSLSKTQGAPYQIKELAPRHSWSSPKIALRPLPLFVSCMFPLWHKSL